METDVLTCSHLKLDALKVAIESAWTKLNEEVVRRSCNTVKARVRLMIKAEGGNFEIRCVHYVFNTLLKSCVKTFFHYFLVFFYKRFFDG